MHNELLICFIIVLVIIDGFINGRIPFVPLLFLATFLSAIIIRERVGRERLDFVNQLKSHRRELRRGGTVVVDNTLVRYDTVLTTYYTNVGMIFTNVAVPSRFRVYTGEEHVQGVLYSLLALLTGWWAFPTGPLITIQMVRQNFGGGDKISVAMLIDAKLFELEEEWREPFVEKETEITEEQTVATGQGSRSSKQINVRTQAPEMPDADKRSASWEYPQPLGTVLAEKWQKKIEEWRRERHKSS